MLALKARHLGGFAFFATFHRLGVPEQALGEIPLYRFWDCCRR